MRSGRESSSGKRYLRYVYFAGAFCVGAVVLLEIALRLGVAWGLLPDGLQARSDLLREPHPYVMFRGSPSHPSFNDLGYPGKAPARPKPDGEFRVIVVGPSTVSLEFTDLLQEEWRRMRREPAVVYNFSSISSNSTQQLVRIVLEVLDYEPDLVVLYGGMLDIETVTFDPRPGNPYNQISVERNPLYVNLGDYPLGLLMLHGTQIGRTFFKAKIAAFFDSFMSDDRDAIRRRVAYGTSDWVARVADRFLKNSLRACQATMATGAEFLGVLGPVNLGAAKEAASEAARQDRLRMDIISGIRAGSAELPSACRSRFADLSSIFDGDRAAFNDRYHLTDDGNRTAAKRLLKALSRVM